MLSPAPLWGYSHARQSSRNFSNMGPSHSLQSFRNRVLRCGFFTGSQVLPEYSLHWVRVPFRHLPVLMWVLQGLQVDIFSTVNLHEPQEGAWLTVVFPVGCRGMSAPTPGAPCSPSSLTLESTKVDNLHTIHSSSLHNYNNRNSPLCPYFPSSR